METPTQALKHALNRMKFYTHAEDLTIYKTPGGWYHVTDSTFEMVLSAPTARTLALCIDAYNAGYNAENALNLEEENARLTRELAELTEYTDIVKRTLFAVIDQRDSSN